MRRLHVSTLQIGRMALDPDQAHHARDVLRLGEGATVELFDPAGQTARGTIVLCTAEQFVVKVDAIDPAPVRGMQWVVASAIPKGNRADWMVEKLSELGCARFMPLAAARSVVLPDGKGKASRWERIAAEAAKQSRRAGVMKIEGLMSVEALLERLTAPCWYLSTAPAAIPARAAMEAVGRPDELALLVGPEGGWTDGEVGAFKKAGLTGVSLGVTILRVETAAVAAGAIVSALLDR